MSVKKGLGRSFDSLLPTELLDETFDPTAAQDEQVSDLRYIKTIDISPNSDQPRRDFEQGALNELAASIEQHGIVQPLVVVATGDGYQIVAGERRWRAALQIGLQKLPVLVRTLSAQHKLEISLIENLQRRDLNPLETATAYLKLRDQFNLSNEQIGQRVGGRAVSTVSNAIRLLGLPTSAKNALVAGSINEGQARQILALEDHPSAQAELLRLIVNGSLSVRQAEQFVIGFKREGRSQGTGKAPKKPASYLQTESPTSRTLAQKLGTIVKQKTTAKGGQLIIHYKNDEDLKRIAGLM